MIADVAVVVRRTALGLGGALVMRMKGVFLLKLASGLSSSTMSLKVEWPLGLCLSMVRTVYVRAGWE